MMLKIKKIMVFFILFLATSQLCFAEARMRTLRTDPRAKSVVYNPYQIYAVKTNYLVSTDIIFSEDEFINHEDYHLGDSSAWDVQINRNHLYIKARKMEAGGNLNVTTNKHTYHFILSVDNAVDSRNQTLFLTFTYPNEPKKKGLSLLENIRLPADLCQDPQKYNLQYSFTGNREQAPIMACDDGTFTYFKFARHIEQPAIFLVLPDRSETVLNYRMEKEFLVVERIGKAYTLRNGKTVTSVYNDKYIGDWQNVCPRSKA